MCDLFGSWLTSPPSIKARRVKWPTHFCQHFTSGLQLWQILGFSLFSLSLSVSLSHSLLLTLLLHFQDRILLVFQADLKPLILTSVSQVLWLQGTDLTQRGAATSGRKANGGNLSGKTFPSSLLSLCFLCGTQEFLFCFRSPENCYTQPFNSKPRKVNNAFPTLRRFAVGVPRVKCVR